MPPPRTEAGNRAPWTPSCRWGHWGWAQTQNSSISVREIICYHQIHERNTKRVTKFNSNTIKDMETLITHRQVVLTSHCHQLRQRNLLPSLQIHVYTSNQNSSWPITSWKGSGKAWSANRRNHLRPPNKREAPGVCLIPALWSSCYLTPGLGTQLKED